MLLQHAVKLVFPKKASSLSLHRNLGKNEVGLVDEIGFEDFLTVMSYFKLPQRKLTEEKTEAVRTEKLRCKNIIQTVMAVLAVYRLIIQRDMRYCFHFFASHYTLSS